MQKWEYLTIFVASTKEKGENVMRVTVANGQRLQKSHPMNGDYRDCPTYVDYIRERGEEGWEMVGIASPGSGLLEIAFKRPKL